MREAFEKWWEEECELGDPPKWGWDFWRKGEGYKNIGNVTIGNIYEVWKAAWEVSRNDNH